MKVNKIDIDGVVTTILIDELKNRFPNVKDATFKIVIPSIIHDSIDLKDYELGKVYKSKELKKFSFIIADDFEKDDDIKSYKLTTASSFTAPNMGISNQKIAKVYYKEV